MTTKAKRRSKLTPRRQCLEIERAIAHLTIAVNRLRSAGSKKAADRAASAKKSAEGALRHARNLIFRDPPKKPGA